MNTCDVDALSRYLDGDMFFPARRQLELHLRSCEQCAADLQALQKVDRALLSLRSTSVVMPADVHARISGTVQRRRKLAPIFALSRMMPAAIGSSIAALLVLVSVNLGVLKQPHQPVAETRATVVAQQRLQEQSTPLLRVRRSSAMLGGQLVTQPIAPVRARAQFDFN